LNCVFAVAILPGVDLKARAREARLMTFPLGE
jgi:hypothetical protein